MSGAIPKNHNRIGFSEPHPNDLPYDAANGGSIPCTSFMQTVAVNVDNKKLSDAAFRQFVRDTISMVG